MHIFPEGHQDFNTPLLDLRKNTNVLDFFRKLTPIHKNPLNKESHRQDRCDLIKIRFRKLSPWFLQTYCEILIYLRCQQERGLVQKARRLMDENSVSFQLF